MRKKIYRYKYDDKIVKETILHTIRQIEEVIWDSMNFHSYTVILMNIEVTGLIMNRI